VYERSDGSTRLISAGAGGVNEFDAFFRGASADGTRVFFETGEQILAADRDGARDVYERYGGTMKKVSPGNGAFDANPKPSPPTARGSCSQPWSGRSQATRTTRPMSTARTSRRRARN
jgi:hypothetical protein